MFGLDLVDFFRGRYTWRKLLSLLDHLPASSAYVEAMADDEERAEWLASLPEDSTARAPRLSQWTPEVDLLAAILDRLGDVVRVTVASSGGKPGETPRYPRPATAIDRARRTARYRRHLDLVEEVHQAQDRYARAEGVTDADR